MIRVLHVSVLILITLICLMVRTSLGSPPDRNLLIRDSSFIVIGTIEAELLVIWPDKLARVEASGEGRGSIKLPNPSEYRAGKLYRLRIEELIRKDRKIRKGQIVNIFVPGGFSLHSTAFSRGQKLMVFLSPLGERGRAYKGASVVSPENISAAGEKFDPKLSYTLVLGDSGAIPVTAENRKMIDELKAAVRNSGN